MILAWACWTYGKVMKWAVIYPLWLLERWIHNLGERIYRHAVSVRRHWDNYMFNQEGRDLR